MKRNLLALSVAALTGSALAADVYVGSAGGEVYRHGSSGVQLVLPSLCAGIDSMTSSGRTLYVADAFANLFVIQTNAGNSIGMVALPAPANSMAAHNGALLIGTPEGVIHRIDPATGQSLASWQVQSSLEAMAVSGDTVYAGGLNTFIYKGSTQSGNFTTFSACFGQVNSLTISGNLLLAGGLDGRVYRFNKDTGQYLGMYQLASTTLPALALDAAALCTTDSAGNLKRVDPASGTLISSIPVTAEATALAIIPECVPDFSGDGLLNVQDFAAFINAFSAREARADIDRSGAHNVLDFAAFLNAYAVGCP